MITSMGMFFKPGAMTTMLSCWYQQPASGVWRGGGRLILLTMIPHSIRALLTGIDPATCRAGATGPLYSPTV